MSKLEDIGREPSFNGTLVGFWVLEVFNHPRYIPAHRTSSSEPLFRELLVVAQVGEYVFLQTGLPKVEQVHVSELLSTPVSTDKRFLFADVDDMIFEQGIIQGEWERITKDSKNNKEVANA